MTLAVFRCSKAGVHNPRPYGRMWPSIKLDAAVHMIM